MKTIELAEMIIQIVTKKVQTITLKVQVILRSLLPQTWHGTAALFLDVVFYIFLVRAYNQGLFQQKYPDVLLHFKSCC